MSLLKNITDEMYLSMKSGDKDVFALVPLLSEWSTNPNYTNLIISKIKKVQKILANEVAKKS